MRILEAIFLIFILYFSLSMIAFAGVCNREDAITAETEASTLSDWTAVFDSYKKYSACDDGAIWEGYSETIGRLLAKDWEHISDLHQLCTKNGEFKKFVLKHIDETVPSEYLDEIIKNTQLRCPSELKKFCLSIENAANYK
jgi:hypothetical protein